MYLILTYLSMKICSSNIKCCWHFGKVFTYNSDITKMFLESPPCAVNHRDLWILGLPFEQLVLTLFQMEIIAYKCCLKYRLLDLFLWSSSSFDVIFNILHNKVHWSIIIYWMYCIWEKLLQYFDHLHFLWFIQFVSPLAFFNFHI